MIRWSASGLEGGSRIRVACDGGLVVPVGRRCVCRRWLESGSPGLGRFGPVVPGWRRREEVMGLRVALSGRKFHGHPTLRPGRLNNIGFCLFSFQALYSIHLLTSRATVKLFSHMQVQVLNCKD